jgi:AcrR family transcriptional regulator
VGRKPGVAAEDTRAALLGAAAGVFARRGYDGASISEITSEAGLTSGAIYAHYGSKAELFVATLRAYMERDLEKLLGGGMGPDLVERITSVGSTFDQREPTEEWLVISAVTAARQHPEVADMLVRLVADREAVFSELLRQGQESGLIAADVSAGAISRLSLMIALGSLMVGALELEPLSHQEWADVMTRLVNGFRAN